MCGRPWHKRFAFLITFFLSSPCAAQQIVVVHENDDLSAIALQHINISLRYLGAKYNFDNLTMLPISFIGVPSPDQLCIPLNASLGVISLARSPAAINTVRNVAAFNEAPIVQIHLDRWTFNNSSIEISSAHPISDETPNYATVVSPLSVFQNVYASIFPMLNSTSTVNIVYETSDLLSMWQQFISAVHSASGVQSKFLPIASAQSLSSQIAQLVQQHSLVLLLASTPAVERFVFAARDYIDRQELNIVVLTKDITPFKCDECRSAELFWIRPYYTGKNLDVRDLMEFVKENEMENEVKQNITGNYEVELAFYLSITNALTSIVRDINATKGEIPTGYPCSSTVLLTFDNATSPSSRLLDGKIREYGVFVQSPDSAAIYQDVPARIFRIDRVKGQEDARYNKLIANWTLEQGAQLYYESLGVNVRELNHFRIVTVVQPPFVERFPDENVGQDYQGYCIDLINLIREEINFTYTLYEVEDGSFGLTDINGNWNGLIGALVSGSADIALAPLSVMAERENDVDFTVPYYDLVGTTILMKKADVEYSLFKFMKVLEWPVWLCIVGAYLFTSILLWIFDRFSPYSYTNNRVSKPSGERYRDDSEKRVFSLKECLWFCMTSLTPQGGGEAPKNVSGRLVAATWWLFGFIIIASYTANLAAFLTVSRLETSISSLDDLAKQYKIEYAPIKGSASETYFRRMAEVEEIFYNIWKEMSLNESMSQQDRARLAVWDYPVSDKFTNMWRYMQESKLPENMSSAIDRVLTSTDGFAFIGDATEIKYAVLTNCKLQQVGTEFSRKPYAIAVQSGHPLKDPISAAILMLLNERRLETLKEKWWTNNPNRVICPDINNESDGISIQNIGGVFIVILAGIVLSLITLAAEYFYYRKRGTTIGKRASEERREETGSHEMRTANGVRSAPATTNGNVLKQRKEVSDGEAKEFPPMNTIAYSNQAFQF